jgi:phosphoribosyl 1,2-cyclic phosphodiesterase
MPGHRSGVTVAEVARLAADLRRMSLRPRAGFATHPHWDHVMECGLGDVPGSHRS